MSVLGWIGIIVVVALLAGSVGFAVGRSRGSATATTVSAAPTGGNATVTRARELTQVAAALATTPAATPTATQGATRPATAARTPSPAATPTVQETFPPISLNETWTDPEKRITVRYPSSWTINVHNTQDENSPLAKARPLVEFTSPTGAVFSVTIYVSTDSLDSDVQATRTELGSPQAGFTLTPTQATTIDGESARTFDASYTKNSQQIRTALWLVNHGSKRFGIGADKIGTERPTIDVLVRAVTFQAG